MQIHINICKNVEKYIKKNSYAAAAALPPKTTGTPTCIKLVALAGNFIIYIGIPKGLWRLSCRLT